MANLLSILKLFTCIDHGAYTTQTLLLTNHSPSERDILTCAEQAFVSRLRIDYPSYSEIIPNTNDSNLPKSSLNLEISKKTSINTTLEGDLQSEIKLPKALELPSGVPPEPRVATIQREREAGRRSDFSFPDQARSLCCPRPSIERREFVRDRDNERPMASRLQASKCDPYAIALVILFILAIVFAAAAVGFVVHLTCGWKQAGTHMHWFFNQGEVSLFIVITSSLLVYKRLADHMLNELVVSWYDYDLLNTQGRLIPSTIRRGRGRRGNHALNREALQPTPPPLYDALSDQTDNEHSHGNEVRTAVHRWPSC